MIMWNENLIHARFWRVISFIMFKQTQKKKKNTITTLAYGKRSLECLFKTFLQGRDQKLKMFRERDFHGMERYNVTKIFRIKFEAIKYNMKQKKLSGISVFDTFETPSKYEITYLVNSFIERELCNWSIVNFSDLLAFGNINVIFKAETAKNFPSAFDES